MFFWNWNKILYEGTQYEGDFTQFSELHNLYIQR